MYYVYILACGDGTLYTGISNHLPRRLQQHQNGTGAKYTRGRSPLHLVFVVEGGDRSLASKEEARIKKLCRKEKEELIASVDKALLAEMTRLAFQEKKDT